MIQDATLTDRLVGLWDHLGLRAAHVATQMPTDLDGLASGHPARIAGLVLCEATSIDPAPLATLAPRMTIIAGEGGMSGQVAERSAEQLPGCRRVTLAGYAAPIWGDCVADNTEAIVEALLALPGEASAPAGLPERGSHAELTYNIRGHGPALVLLPLFLAPSQWEPAVPALAERYTVITLGGRHLSGAALLEDRAMSVSYRAMAMTLLELMAPASGETLLEVGCGSGAVTRLVAARLGAVNPITAVDVNPYLLREAAALAEAEGLAEQIHFGEGNAEHLPFNDEHFDHAFSVTVLEECDAERALSELWRVVRPGGRVGVIVRATELPHAWNLGLEDPLRTKVDGRPPLVGPRGVADRSLYARMAAAGFERLSCFPMLAAIDRTNGPFFRYLQGNVVARLDARERPLFEAARKAALDGGVLFTVCPHHCVVGRRPPTSRP